jgi:hypothetical protein
MQNIKALLNKMMIIGFLMIIMFNVIGMVDEVYCLITGDSFTLEPSLWLIDRLMSIFV